MKIFGDQESSSLTRYVQEPGMLWGYNDVLKGEISTHTTTTYSNIFGVTEKTYTVEPKLHLHIARDAWSSFTGWLREYFLPWRWHSVYLDQGDGTAPQRILVCVNLYDRYSDNEKYSECLLQLLDKPFFVANLIKTGLYRQLFFPSAEYILIEDGQRITRKIVHPILGKSVGYQVSYNSTDCLCPIYRISGVFSFFTYHFLKHFSRGWEEVAIKVEGASAQILIKKTERMHFSNAGLISAPN